MRSRRLGSALRRLRETARIDQQQAAEYIAGSKAKVSRIEAGQVSARPGDVRLLLEFYGVEDREVYRHLEQLARDSNKRGWWLDYPIPDGFGDFIALEENATLVRSWQPLIIPGLLQTAGYTRALVEGNPNVTSSEVVEGVVKIRQERRRKLQDSGARFNAVVGESALTSPIPDVSVHREQLASILESAQQASTTVQVLPTSEWAATRCSPGFIMLSFDGEWSPTAVSQDTPGNLAIVEGPEQIVPYAHAFEELQSSALTPNDSQTFLQNAMESLSEEP